MLLSFAGSVLVYSGVKGRDVRELITAGFNGKAAPAAGTITHESTAAQRIADAQAGRTHDPHDTSSNRPRYVAPRPTKTIPVVVPRIRLNPF